MPSRKPRKAPRTLPEIQLAYLLDEPLTKAEQARAQATLDAADLERAKFNYAVDVPTETDLRRLILAPNGQLNFYADLRRRAAKRGAEAIQTKAQPWQTALEDFAKAKRKKKPKATTSWIALRAVIELKALGLKKSERRAESTYRHHLDTLSR